MEFGWRFFPKTNSVNLKSFSFDPEKSPHTYRIFVMGASAAAGIPDPSYNFGRFLEIMLQDRYPQTQFEVVTVAIPAINSHGVLPIAKDCAQYDPDLFIVYLGNNEVVGPFGASTALSPLAPSLLLIRGHLAAKAMKTGQLLEFLVSSFGSKKDKKRNFGGMVMGMNIEKMYLEKQVRHDSEGLKQVYSHYEKNLKGIVKAGRKAGAKVIVSNVGCNLKDNPPFASQHQEGLASSEKQVWKEKYQKGIGCETAGQFDRAIEQYLAAEQIDGSFADLQFRLGRCYWQLGEFQKAKKRYILAREYDTLRFRPDIQINRIIESVAAERTDEGVYFVDTVKALEVNSPHNTPGNELFYEHVHYRIEGNYILAHTMFETIEIILPDNIKQQKRERPILSLKQCKDRFVYTGFEEFQLADKVLHKFIEHPPFTNQLNHIDRINEHKKGIERLMVYKEAPYLNEVVSQYKQRILENPTDWRLHHKLGVVLLDGQEELDLALDEFEKVVTFLPDILSYSYIVQILEKQDKLDELIRYYEQLLKITTGKRKIYYDYAEVLREKGDHKNAIKNYQKSLYLFPTPDLDIYILLADSYNKSGNGQKALRVIRRALRSADTNMAFDVATFFSLLQELGETRLALDYYRQVLEVRPNVLPILKQLAWILAAHPNNDIRDPASAVQYAERACELTGYKEINPLDTLAVAYAAAGDFRLAVTTAKKAAALAKQKGSQSLVQKMQGRLRLYRSGKRYIDPQLG
jgi:tetratricopeptide (TPR) repeat protein